MYIQYPDLKVASRLSTMANTPITFNLWCNQKSQSRCWRGDRFFSLSN